MQHYCKRGKQTDWLQHKIFTVKLLTWNSVTNSWFRLGFLKDLLKLTSLWGGSVIFSKFLRISFQWLWCNIQIVSTLSGPNAKASVSHQVCLPSPTASMSEIVCTGWGRDSILWKGTKLISSSLTMKGIYIFFPILLSWRESWNSLGQKGFPEASPRCGSACCLSAQVLPSCHCVCAHMHTWLGVKIPSTLQHLFSFL